MTDEEPEPGDVRVFDRLRAAGLSVGRIEAHLAAGRVHVDDQVSSAGRATTRPLSP